MKTAKTMTPQEEAAWTKYAMRGQLYEGGVNQRPRRADRSATIVDPYVKCRVPSCWAYTKSETRVCTEATWDDAHWQYVMAQSLKKRKSA